MGNQKIEKDPPAAPAPLLSIETILPTEFITIDGYRYELRQQAEMSLFDLRKFERLRERMSVLQALEAPTPKEEKELDLLLLDTARLVTTAPAFPPGSTEDPLGRCRPQSLMRIVVAFLRLSRARRVALAALEVPEAEAAAVDEASSTTSN